MPLFRLARFSAFVKQRIQNILSTFGWRLSRLETGVLAADHSRIIWRAHYRGRSFLCFKGDVITDHLLAGKGFEEQLLGVLKSVASDATGDVIEVGANIGTTFVTVARDFPQLHFHCVEPVPEFFALLKENAQTFAATNVTLYPLALASTSDKEIHIHTLLGTAGAVKRFDGYVSGVITKKCRTMDELFKGSRPLLVKVDVDGFELDVLRGGAGLLKKWQPWLYLEYDTKIMRRVHSSPEELQALLESLGYQSMRVWDAADRWLGDLASFRELDRLCAGLPFHANVLFATQKQPLPQPSQ